MQLVVVSCNDDYMTAWLNVKGIFSKISNEIILHNVSEGFKPVGLGMETPFAKNFAVGEAFPRSMLEEFAGADDAVLKCGEWAAIG